MNTKMRFIILSVTCAVIAAVFVCGCGINGKTGTAISKDGVPIAYTIYGKGDAVLVFVHGWCARQAAWQKQVPYFEKKYRVVTLDLAGHGKSGKGRKIYTMEAFGEDVAAVVRKINAPKVILIGHSMGGPVIIKADEIIPDKVAALIGIDTFQDFERKFTPEQIENFIKPFKENFKKTADSFMRSMAAKNTDKKLIDEIARAASSAPPKIGISALEEMLKTSYVDNPPKVTAPIWCVNSDLRPTKAGVNRKFVPVFNVYYMPGLSHFLMLEKPDEFNHKLDEIIKQILR